MQSFKTLEPCGSHQIRSLDYSLSGNHLLIASGKAQAKIIDREGREVLECAKGDQYLCDLTKTAVCLTFAIALLSPYSHPSYEM